MNPPDPLPPLDERPSLLSFLRANRRPDGALTNSMLALPAERSRDHAGSEFAMGARDAMATHLIPVRPDGASADALCALIHRACASPTRETLVALADALSGDVILAMDPLLDRLAAQPPSRAALERLAVWLATTSPSRGPVKLGIALLGLLGVPDETLLFELGAHEEFTLFAAAAFCRARANPEPALFVLARRVRVWARIHCVQRLKGAKDPTIARWILTEGFRNTIDDGFLAHLAATTGRLVDALASPDLTRAVFVAGRDILEALLLGGPAESIDDYEEAPRALELWLTRAAEHGADLWDLSAIESIARFVGPPEDEEDAERWAWRRKSGRWTEEMRSRVEAAACDLAADPRWALVVREALRRDPDDSIARDLAAFVVLAR